MSEFRIVEQVQYYVGIESELKGLLKTFSSTANFEDDTWPMDKAKKRPTETNDRYTGYFSKIPAANRSHVKFYVLVTIMNKQIQAKTSVNLPADLTRFFNFLAALGISLENVDLNTMNLFVQFLAGEKQLRYASKASTWNAVVEFFLKMAGWPFMPRQIQLPRDNPFPQYRKKKKNLTKMQSLKKLHQKRRTSKKVLALNAECCIGMKKTCIL